MTGKAVTNLYLTQDKIGTPTGGGLVTFHEYRALESLGEKTYPLDSNIVQISHDPFQNDAQCLSLLRRNSTVTGKLAHLYAGCFTKSVGELKKRGFKVSYTAAAHDIGESKAEFDKLGLTGHFPHHLIEPGLWKEYVGGYLAADLVICPSKLSKRCMESYGCKNVIVIPHGCDPNSGHAVPFPKQFTVGYLGQAGPDKGLRYLFEAWKKADLKDAVLLIAGNNIEQALPLWRQFGGGNVRFMGFVKHVSEFYSKISVYVQPSVTEGFGIEVLEALAYGRPVICSEGAGAVDVITDRVGRSFPARNVDALVAEIQNYQKDPRKLETAGGYAVMDAGQYSWEEVSKQYVKAWSTL